MLGNPVRGHIYAHDEVPPAGAFWVTASFGQIDAYHPGPLGHQGIDIGNKTCGFDILAVEDGTITESFKSGSGAYITRYRLTKYPNLEPALAHMPGLLVSVGQKVIRGQKIGACGSSGADACHLHGGMKKLINGVWVEFDWWDLLDQNGGGDMIPVPGANFKSIHNKKSVLKFNGNFRDERKSGNVLELFPAGTVIYPVAYANDGDVPTDSQSGEWWACWLYVKARSGAMLGWFHSSLVDTLVDDIAVGGFTQTAINNAKAAGRAAGIQAAKDDLADLK